MKRYALLIVILSFALTLCAFATKEGDYGYYDTTADGKIEIADALGTLKEILNEDGSILRVIHTLKLITSGEVISPAITEINTEEKTVTLLLGSSDEKGYFTVPMEKIGFNEYYHLDFFNNGFVTMTVSGDFKTSKNLSLLHAAEAYSRYDIAEIRLTAGNITATVNGKNEVLTEAPFMKDGKLFVNAAFLGEKFEENIEGESVCAADIAEKYGAKATFDTDSNTLVIVKQFLPTLTVTNASGKAGEEIDITVSFSHNPGISGIQLSLGYDSSAMSYVSAQNVSNGMFTQSSPSAGANPFKFVAAHLGLKEVKGDLTFTTVKFKISDNAQIGTYPIECKDFQAYDSIISQLTVKASSSSITVTE